MAINEKDRIGQKLSDMMDSPSPASSGWRICEFRPGAKVKKPTVQFTAFTFSQLHVDRRRDLHDKIILGGESFSSRTQEKIDAQKESNPWIFATATEGETNLGRSKLEKSRDTGMSSNERDYLSDHCYFLLSQKGDMIDVDENEYKRISKWTESSGDEKKKNFEFFECLNKIVEIAEKFRPLRMELHNMQTARNSYPSLRFDDKALGKAKALEKDARQVNSELQGTMRIKSIQDDVAGLIGGITGVKDELSAVLSLNDPVYIPGGTPPSNSGSGEGFDPDTHAPESPDPVDDPVDGMAGEA